jgi:thioesterase domain-containing protein
MTNTELEKFIHEQIPISKAMGVKIIKADDESVEIFGPLEPNRNHLGTAFGGSLNALLVLAGYSWIFNSLENQGHHCHILLKSGHTEYIHPVEEGLTAICLKPSQEVLDEFIRIYERKGLARINLVSEVTSPQGPACIFKGEFVAQRAQQSQLG